MPDPLDLSVGVADLLAALTPPEQEAVDRGALDPREVWYEFVTLEDERVRPSHRALHGTVWKAGDPNAPVPPLDYGCRCSLRYVAPPGSQVAAKRLLPPSPQPTTDTVPAVYADYLKGRLPGFDLPRAVREAEKLPPAEQLPTLVEVLQKASPELSAGQARDMARMAMQARREGQIQPGKPSPVLPSSPLTLPAPAQDTGMSAPAPTAGTETLAAGLTKTEARQQGMALRRAGTVVFIEPDGGGTAARPTYRVYRILPRG